MLGAVAFLLVGIALCVFALGLWFSWRGRNQKHSPHIVTAPNRTGPQSRPSATLQIATDDRIGTEVPVIPVQLPGVQAVTEELIEVFEPGTNAEPSIADGGPSGSPEPIGAETDGTGAPAASDQHSYPEEATNNASASCDTVLPTPEPENELPPSPPLVIGVTTEKEHREVTGNSEPDHPDTESMNLVHDPIVVVPVEPADPIALEPPHGPEPCTDRSQTAKLEASGATVPAKKVRSKPARHRDRRGQRRAPLPQVTAAQEKPAETAVLERRAPAEARLRLMIHPVRRAVSLSVVLARPAGYPGEITLRLEAGIGVSAYDESRYDDVDLAWTPSLLSGEIRLDCREGYQWLRSGRRIHIFSETADEPGLMSTGSAIMAVSSTIVCREEDAETVQSIARKCGSAELTSYDRWSGIPDGWTVLSGYRPAHAASSAIEADCSVLDPGIGVTIGLSGDQEIRAGSFAQGSPPKIEITPFPVGANVTIDGIPAKIEADGGWRAAGWDQPGDHLIDIVPGPSASYRIVSDPWLNGGWESWDAHPARFMSSPQAPWGRALICGARVSGQAGEHLIAAETTATMIALGLQRGSAILQPRPDAPVSVGLLSEPPAFLISALGRRRTQGRVTWLAPPPQGSSSRVIDHLWVTAVRAAASKRLPFIGASGQDVWRKARERARRYRRPRK